MSCEDIWVFAMKLKKQLRLVWSRDSFLVGCCFETSTWGSGARDTRFIYKPDPNSVHNSFPFPSLKFSAIEITIPSYHGQSTANSVHLFLASFGSPLDLAFEGLESM